MYAICAIIRYNVKFIGHYVRMYRKIQDPRNILTLFWNLCEPVEVLSKLINSPGTFVETNNPHSTFVQTNNPHHGFTRTNNHFHQHFLLTFLNELCILYKGVTMDTAKKEQVIDLINKGNLLDAAELLVRIETDPIEEPNDLKEYLKKWMFKKVEYFLVATLNSQNKVIQVHEISKGTVDKTIVAARDVFRAAILDNASSIILAHNHPGGSLEFGKKDRLLTREFVKIGKLVGIPVLDHLIIGHGKYASAVEQCVLKTYSKDII